MFFTPFRQGKRRPLSCRPAIASGIVLGIVLGIAALVVLDAGWGCEMGWKIKKYSNYKDLLYNYILIS